MTKRRLKQLMLLLMFLSATDGWAPAHKVFSLSAVPASIKKQTLNTIDAGLHWEDKAGEHLALFSSSRSKTNTVTLTAQHFSIVEGQPHLVRAIKEVRACPEFDNVTAFIQSSIGLTDLDQDGLAEISFMYVTDCVSDMSPQSAKLLILEDGKKYAIRGSTKYIDPQVSVKTEFVLGAHFNSLSKAMQSFAITLWHREAVTPLSARTKSLLFRQPKAPMP